VLDVFIIINPVSQLAHVVIAKYFEVESFYKGEGFPSCGLELLQAGHNKMKCLFYHNSLNIKEISFILKDTAS